VKPVIETNGRRDAHQVLRARVFVFAGDPPWQYQDNFSDLNFATDSRAARGEDFRKQELLSMNDTLRFKDDSLDSPVVQLVLNQPSVTECESEAVGSSVGSVISRHIRDSRRVYILAKLVRKPKNRSVQILLVSNLTLCLA
jgi:hypothetical protein